jgi:hypothetical protein
MSHIDRIINSLEKIIEVEEKHTIIINKLENKLTIEKERDNKIIDQLLKRIKDLETEIKTYDNDNIKDNNNMKQVHLCNDILTEKYNNILCSRCNKY